jgi:hypothetical protein
MVMHHCRGDDFLTGLKLFDVGHEELQPGLDLETKRINLPLSRTRAE